MVQIKLLFQRFVHVSFYIYLWFYVFLVLTSHFVQILLQRNLFSVA